MSEEPTAPVVNGAWIVTHSDSEHLCVRAFTNYKVAMKEAREIANDNPYDKVEVAYYLIAPNSHRTVGPHGSSIT